MSQQIYMSSMCFLSPSIVVVDCYVAGDGAVIIQDDVGSYFHAVRALLYERVSDEDERDIYLVTRLQVGAVQ
jgi:hypothetical protein